MHLLSILLGITAGVSLVISGWLGSKAYFGWTRYVPGRPLDSIENRFAFAEAIKSATSNPWRPLELRATLWFCLTAGSMACLFALNGRVDGALGFGLVCLIGLVSTTWHWFRRPQP